MLSTINAEVPVPPLGGFRSGGCRQCSGKIVDAGEELVCSSCGIVTLKEVTDERPSTTSLVTQASDYGGHPLGSFLGPAEVGYDEVFSKGFSKSSSTFRYLKTISDYSYSRKEGSVLACTKLIERVCEKLGLTHSVAGEAVRIAREIIAVRKDRGSFTMAAISAYTVITSCKIQGVASAGVKDIVATHRALGYRVKTSTIIQISIDSPVRVGARRPEDYLSNVIALLPSVAFEGEARIPQGYIKRLHLVSRLALEVVDVPSRGGHNPRALAATAVYAAEFALASVEGRKKFLSQRDVAACVGAAEYTVREQFVEIFRERIGTICEAIRSRESPTLGGSSRSYQTPLRPLAQLS